VTLHRVIFSREDLAELDIPASAVYTEYADEGRWAVIRWAVFAYAGQHWAVTYQLPATEEQECDLWFDEDEITATRVELRETTVMKWVEVDEDEDNF